MNAADLIRRLHQHRAWVTRNVLTVAAPLTDEQLKTQFAIGQGSVWKSLTHLQAAEYVWLGALQGEENPVLPGDLPGHLPGNQLGEGGFTDLPDLTRKWAALEQRWTTYLESLQPESLDEIVYKISTATGKEIRFGCRRSDILLHVCTHAQYTIAQVVNMFRQLGIQKFPDTMLIAMARQETR